MQANDYITHIDDEPVQGLTLNQAVDKMRGPVNAPIKIRIVRKGQDKPIEMTLTRDIIKVLSVRSHSEGDDVGYVRITQFSEKTSEGLKKAIADLSAQDGDKLKGFIVDLRNNPGGLLDQAIAVSDAFLEKGEIVSTRGRNADETQRFSAHAGDLTKGKPVIVLINGGSASASEIVAGAMQDHKRATILGTRSFGKGSVQTIIPLGSGNGALRLTTARYFTPSGRSIQAKGIVPDIEVLQDVPEDQKARTDTKGGEASLRGHLKAEGDEENRLARLCPAGREGRQGAARRRRAHPRRAKERSLSARPEAGGAELTSRPTRLIARRGGLSRPPRLFDGSGAENRGSAARTAAPKPLPEKPPFLRIATAGWFTSRAIFCGIRD